MSASSPEGPGSCWSIDIIGRQNLIKTAVPTVAHGKDFDHVRVLCGRARHTPSPNHWRSAGCRPSPARDPVAGEVTNAERAAARGTLVNLGRLRVDHAHVVARMALEMRTCVGRQEFNGKRLRFRIGMNSGLVVAGVIGRKKFI
jgi:class 3 adenylate cyclase